MRSDREIIRDTSADAHLLAGADFATLWAEGWQVMRRSCDLTRSEAGVIDDLSRLRGCGMVRRGLEIVRATSTNPMDRFALLEKLRGFMLAGLAVDLTEAEATLRETEANGRGNVAQVRHIHYRSRGSREAVIESMTEQSIASRLLADVVRVERPALIKAG